jgi:steroid Delta-isomerase
VSGPVDAEAAAHRVIEFFETLQLASLARLGEIYTHHAYFKDPFNDVRGLPGIERVFSHMFEALDKPRFIVTDSISQNGQCFLTWNFEFHFRNFDKTRMHTVHGGSHLKFNGCGLVDYHRDYWDAAEELYEKLPAVGVLMRWLKRRATP